jgi:hypothetical protein
MFVKYWRLRLGATNETIANFKALLIGVNKAKYLRFKNITIEGISLLLDEQFDTFFFLNTANILNK